MITQADLKKHLAYDSESGDFHWITTRNRCRAGNKAGTIRHEYLTIKFLGKNYQAHRLAWLYVYGVLPVADIDHINGCRNDNRLCNLREATRQQNCFNSLVRKNNSTGYKGVIPTRYGTYRAKAMLHGIRVELGSFKTPEEAHAAYLNFTKGHHGEFHAEKRAK